MDANLSICFIVIIHLYHIKYIWTCMVLDWFLQNLALCFLFSPILITHMTSNELGRLYKSVWLDMYYILTTFIFQSPVKGASVHFIGILWINFSSTYFAIIPNDWHFTSRKVRYRKMKWLAHGHRESKGQAWFKPRSVWLQSLSYMPKDLWGNQHQEKKKKRLKKFLNAIQPSHYTFRLVPYTCMSDTFSVSSMSPKSKLSNSDGAAGGTVRRQHTIVTSTGSSFRTVTTSWWSSPSRVMPFTCAKRKVGQERRLPSRTTPFKAIFYYININCTQGMIIAVLCSELWLDL